MSVSSTSVVICTRNRPEQFARCLMSVAESSVRPLEVVVVDQSSSDCTGKVIEALSSKLVVPVHYLRLETVGHTVARNVGIKESRGDIIAFTDDDCTVDIHWLEFLSREFRNHRVSGVCGQTRPANHADRPGPALISTVMCDERKLLRGRRNPVTIGKGNNMAFRRKDLLSLGCFNEQIGCGTKVFAGDDTDLFYRLLSVGGVIVRAPEAVVLHSQPDDLREVVKKKRGYSVSAAAVLASRVRYGDMYAAGLLFAKLLYEFGFLFCGGILRMNRWLTAIGWNSMLGTVSGMRYLLNNDFCSGFHRLSEHACRSYTSGDMLVADAAGADSEIGSQR